MGINNDVVGVPPLGDWQELTLINGWLRYSTSWPPARIFLDPLGIAHLSGIIRGGSAGQFATLPAGMRPDFRLEFPVICKFVSSAVQIGQVGIATTGPISSIHSNLEWLSLEGITFRAS